ncbi:hypothetical protein ACFL4O_03970, partial [bacterium]
FMVLNLIITDFIGDISKRKKDLYSGQYFKYSLYALYPKKRGNFNKKRLIEFCGSFVKIATRVSISPDIYTSLFKSHKDKTEKIYDKGIDFLVRLLKDIKSSVSIKKIFFEVQLKNYVTKANYRKTEPYMTLMPKEFYMLTNVLNKGAKEIFFLSMLQMPITPFSFIRECLNTVKQRNYRLIIFLDNLPVTTYEELANILSLFIDKKQQDRPLFAVKNSACKSRVDEYSSSGQAFYKEKIIFIVEEAISYPVLLFVSLMKYYLKDRVIVLGNADPIKQILKQIKEKKYYEISEKENLFPKQKFGAYVVSPKDGFLVCGEKMSFWRKLQPDFNLNLFNMTEQGFFTFMDRIYGNNEKMHKKNNNDGKETKEIVPLCDIKGLNNKHYEQDMSPELSYYFAEGYNFRDVLKNKAQSTKFIKYYMYYFMPNLSPKIMEDYGGLSEKIKDKYKEKIYKIFGNILDNFYGLPMQMRTQESFNKLFLMQMYKQKQASFLTSTDNKLLFIKDMLEYLIPVYHYSDIDNLLKTNSDDMINLFFEKEKGVLPKLIKYFEETDWWDYGQLKDIVFIKLIKTKIGRFFYKNKLPYKADFWSARLNAKNTKQEEDLIIKHTKISKEAAKEIEELKKKIIKYLSLGRLYSFFDKKLQKPNKQIKNKTVFFDIINYVPVISIKSLNNNSVFYAVKKYVNEIKSLKYKYLIFNVTRKDLKEADEAIIKNIISLFDNSVWNYGKIIIYTDEDMTEQAKRFIFEIKARLKDRVILIGNEHDLEKVEIDLRADSVTNKSIKDIIKDFEQKIMDKQREEQEQAGALQKHKKQN